jgi:GR25 family glycosyltransferase involved in LPS biosynthesis
MKAYFITNIENDEAAAVGHRHVNLVNSKGSFEAEIYEAVKGKEAYDIFKTYNIKFLDEKYQTGEFVERNRQMTYDKKEGVAGCFASHYMLWQRCVAADESIGIFEYDAKQIADMPAVEFDNVLYLSAWRNWDGTDSDKYFEKRTEQGIHDYIGYNRWGYNNCMSGTHAYLIKPHAAQKLIDVAHKKGWFPVDRFFSTDLTNMSKQTLNPAVFKVACSLNLSYQYRVVKIT